MKGFPKLLWYPDQTLSPTEARTGTLNFRGHHTFAEEAYVLR